MGDVVELHPEVIWACNCGCPRMWVYRDGRLQCSECETWQSFRLIPQTDEEHGQ